RSGPGLRRRSPRLPTVSGAAYRERAGGGGGAPGPDPVRVLRARGARASPGERRVDQGKRESGARRERDPAHDVRPEDQAGGAGGRGRAGPLRPPGLRNRDPSGGAPRRSSGLRPADHPVRPRLASVGGLSGGGGGVPRARSGGSARGLDWDGVERRGGGHGRRIRGSRGGAFTRIDRERRKRVRRGGLGRGLSALIPGAETPAAHEALRN